MKENSILRAVREGRAALGTGLKEFGSRGVPWIIEASGFDYVAIDHEHGAFDLETIADLAGWFPGHQRVADRAHPQIVRAYDPRHPRPGHHGHPGL
jgi:2-keto-3-deoxy-L-rhamnonate aldolase RhmA